MYCFLVAVKVVALIETIAKAAAMLGTSEKYISQTALMPPRLPRPHSTCEMVQLGFAGRGAVQFTERGDWASTGQAGGSCGR